MTQRELDRLSALLRAEELWRGNHAVVAGIDEVGRGPLAGPVVTAAVILPRDFNILGVNDSKQLTEKRREALYKEITEAAVAWSVGLRDNRVIDDINSTPQRKP